MTSTAAPAGIASSAAISAETHSDCTTSGWLGLRPWSQHGSPAAGDSRRAAQATTPLARQAAAATRHAGGQSAGRSSNGSRLAGTAIVVRDMVFDHGTLLGGRYTTRRKSSCAELIRVGAE